MSTAIHGLSTIWLVPHLLDPGPDARRCAGALRACRPARHARRRPRPAAPRHDHRGGPDALHDGGAEIRDRFARGPFLVVVVDEARHEDGAAAALLAIEHQPAVVEEAVRARPDDRIGAGAVALERRREPGGGVILRIARQQPRPPAEAAVFRRIPPEPGIPRDLVADRRERDIDRAVVVRAGQAVLRVAARARHRRLVLPLQRPVAIGARARNDIDVGVRGRGLLLRERARAPEARTARTARRRQAPEGSGTPGVSHSSLVTLAAATTLAAGPRRTRRRRAKTRTRRAEGAGSRHRTATTDAAA